MSGVLHSSPFIHGGNRVDRLMRQVLLALLPGIVVATALMGIGVLVNLVVASTTALLAEWAMVRIRRRDAGAVLADTSALLTAVLLALALPAYAPWWLVVVATGFAIVVAKQLYGGLGQNPFNPAMVGYVLAIISFPREMTTWPTLGFPPEVGIGQQLAIQFLGAVPPDAVTAATPLDSVKTHLGMGETLSEMTTAPFLGTLGGAGWEWINLAFLAGGAWMLWRGTIRWHIPVAMLGSLATMALLFWMVDGDRFASPLFHLFSGATMLGAFFIATDPVTAAASPRGRLLYAAGIGILTWLIRNFGGYPDGVAFSVLLMNMAVPAIDYYTRPPVFGERQGDDSDVA